MILREKIFRGVVAPATPIVGLQYAPADSLADIQKAARWLAAAVLANDHDSHARFAVFVGRNNQKITR